MKNILSVLLTSTVLTTAAFANAGPAPVSTPCPACPEAPVAKWSGFKLGAQLGYAHSSSRVRADLGSFSASTSFSEKGVVGGVHAGYDFQLGKNWLLGAEASFDVSGVKGHTRFSDGQNTLSFTTKQKWTVAVVPRLGYVMNDSLFYVGAGWAGTKFDGLSDDFENALRLSVGAGQKMNRVLLGVEANYDFYGSQDGGIKPRVLTAKVKLSFCL